MADFEIKQGDTSPSLEVTLTRVTEGIDASEPLTGANVAFHMRRQDDPLVAVHGPAQIVDPDTGLVRYNWIPGDTGIPGDYYGEFEVIRSDGSIESFPNDSYGFTIKVWPDIY